MKEKIYNQIADYEMTPERGFVGVGINYNSPTRAGVQVSPGSFGTLKPSYPLLYGHDTSINGLLGTFSAEDTNTHLIVRAKLAGTAGADIVYELLKDRSIDGLSVGFWGLRHEFVEDVRVYNAAELFECSVTYQPADPSARVAVVNSVRDMEGILRDVGFTRSRAKEGASLLKPLLAQREVVSLTDVVNSILGVKNDRN